MKYLHEWLQHNMTKTAEWGDDMYISGSFRAWVQLSGNMGPGQVSWPQIPSDVGSFASLIHDGKKNEFG